jgi:hypothetical protein
MIRMLVGSNNFFKNAFYVALAFAFFQAAQAQPAFTSTPIEIATYNAIYNYSITTTGDPREILITNGTLPAGLTFVDNADGTASISGTPTVVGSFPLELTVRHLVNPPLEQDIQSFVLIISKANASIVLSNLTQTFDTTPKSATVTTIPIGLTVDLTYNGSSTPPTNAGNYSVIATINDINYQGTTSETLSIGKATPSITWLNPASIIYETPLSATQLNATSPISGTFTYSPIVGTVLNAGVNQILTANFTPTDVANYNVNGATVQITVNKATPSITWLNPASITYGTPLSGTQLNATSPVVGTFTYSPIATTVLNAGINQTLTANFTPTDAANYNVNGATVQITVNKATPSITWLNPASITYNTALSGTQLNATSSTAGTFTYSPVAGTILNAGANQTLTANFTPTDAANYNVNGATVQITVNKATPSITWLNPSSINFGTALSGTQLNATSSTAGTFTYSPIAGTILNAGVNQTLTANFTPTDAANYNVVNGTTVQITVNKLTPTITWLNPASITYGTALSGTQLSATSSIAGTFSYAPAAGTILNAGANQPLSVNFIPTDAVNYNSVNGTQVVITVSKATPTVNWTNPAAITYGTALSATQLSASSSTAGTFAYTPALGTILNAGPNQILSTNFTPTNATNYNSVIGTTVQITVNKATPSITWPTPTAITYGTALSATQLNASSVVAGTFTYTPVAGTILNAGANQLLSTNFTPTDASNYNPVNGTTVLITVNKSTPTISWPTPTSIVYGTALSATQLNATSSVAGTFSYAPALGTILSAGANQSLSVNFTPTDAVNYNSVNGTQVLITVAKADPIITWPPPQPIKVGVALSATQLNATANVVGTFVYTPAAGTLLSVGVNQVLSVSFTPSNTANYNSVPSTTVFITVSNKDNPIITWPNPSAISYGTLLSATQLNATANVVGTFSYTPPISTLLSAGTNQTLSVNFTPADAITYNSVSSTVQLTVNKAVLTATAANASRAYGATNPTFSIGYSGFVNSETAAVIDTPPTMTCSAIGSSGAGSSFPIVPASGVDNNYSFTYVNGSLSITKATLTAKPDDKSRSYGLANPTFTISYAGFVNSDNVSAIAAPTASTTATPTSSVNTYPITLSGGSSANYILSFQNGTLTINTSPLTAKATNLSKLFGDANPVLTITYSGFLHADNASSITEPAISTLATAASNVGSYPITLSGGTALNYSIILQNGTMTVNQAPLIAKADDFSIQYGQAIPTFTISYTGFVNGNTASSITQPTVSTTATPASNVNTYPITLSGGSAANYNLTLQNGTLTINKATPIITWANPAAINLGIALGVTQLNATSSVAGSFIYTPPIGTVLLAGINQILSVNFNPSDAINYNSVLGTTVQITVVPIVPVIDNFSPTAGVVGTTVTITGSNFDNSLGNNLVKFNGTDAFVTASSSTSITTSVPTGATSGSITVTRLGQTGTSSSIFNVLAPAPSSQPTNIQFSQVTTNSLSASFTSATGNPTGYLVVRKADTAPVTAVPVSGISYALGATLGDATIVHNGSSTSFNDLGLNLNTLYFYGVFSFNGAGTSVNYLTNNPLIGSQKTLLVVDATPPQVASNLTVGNGEVNTSIVISANFQDDQSGIASAKVKYRAIAGSGNFKTADMANTGALNYQYTLPINVASDLGVEYKFSVTNGVGLINLDSTKIYSVGIKHSNGLPITTYPSSAAGGDVTNYRMIGIPLVLSRTTANDIFGNVLGNYDPTNWRMFQFNGSTFDELNGNSPVILGKGYWFISRSAQELKTGEGTTVAVTASSPFALTLQPGWNQIGNPYPFAISWADVVAANPSQAQNLGGNESKIRVYRGSQSDVDVLTKFEGGFVKYLGSTPASIKIPVVKNASLQGGRRDASGARKNDLSQLDWEILFKLSVGKSVYELGGVGMNQSAQDGFDYFDNFNAPRFINYLEIQHPKKYFGMTYTKDIVSTGNQYIWQFKVESNMIEQYSSLAWDNTYFGVEKEIYLLDVSTHRVINMSSVDHYEFDRSSSKEFKVIFGDTDFAKEALLPDRAVLYDPYPNPFEGKLTIEYSLPKEAARQKTTLSIFDINGSRVVNAELPAQGGLNSWVWEPNQQASGVYLVRLEMGNQIVMKKILKR